MIVASGGTLTAKPTIRGSVYIDLTGLDEALRTLLIYYRRAPQLTEMLQKWEARYSAFVLQRFERYSRGGGDWAPLAESTQKRRRRGVGRRDIARTSILIDTGILRNSLDFKASGPFEAWRRTYQGAYLWEMVGEGVELSLNGPARYPNGTAVADVIRFHDSGGPRLPQRRIIVPPDGATLAAMTADAQKAYRDMIAATSNTRSSYGRFREWRTGAIEVKARTIFGAAPNDAPRG